MLRNPRFCLHAKIYTLFSKSRDGQAATVFEISSFQNCRQLFQRDFILSPRSVMHVIFVL